MNSSPPLKADRMRCADGHLIVPYILPIHLKPEHHPLTVAEFFGIDDTPVTCE